MPQKRTQTQATRTRARLAVIAVLALYSQASLHSQVPCKYEIAAIILGPECAYSGPAPTMATAISPNGRWVVGRYSQCDEPRDEAWYYDMSTGEFFTITRPAGVYTARALGVNDAGLVTGDWARSGVGTRGFVFDIKSRQWTELAPIEGDTHSSASAISSKVQRIAGISVGYPYKAVVWQGSTVTILKPTYGSEAAAYGLDESGQNVTGWMGPETPNYEKGFVWSESGVVEIPWVKFSNITEAKSVNSFGEATGRVLYPDQECPGSIVHTLVWQNGEVMDIGALPSDDDSAGYGINDSKLVVGLSRDSIDCSGIRDNAFVWSAFTGMLNLNELVIEKGGWHTREANAINRLGHIAGTAEDADHTLAGIVITPIPRAGDTNCDGVRNVDDLMEVINNWGPCRGCVADLNHDWIVNVDDLLEVINNWG